MARGACRASAPNRRLGLRTTYSKTQAPASHPLRSPRGRQPCALGGRRAPVILPAPRTLPPACYELFFATSISSNLVRGRCTVNVEPSPSRLLTLIVPPCCSIPGRALARPIPVPPPRPAVF